MLHLMIKPGQLSLKQLRQVSRSPVVLSLDPEAIPAIAESAQVVEQVISEGRTVYGINTGFGLLANTKNCPARSGNAAKEHRAFSCCGHR
ncbi:aromatic amino acid lyase family protein [Vibrio cholerae]|nr:aromatic amino acid lyase family protein [Vibrio cholerae]